MGTPDTIAGCRKSDAGAGRLDHRDEREEDGERKGSRKGPSDVRRSVITSSSGRVAARRRREET
jgi:hypothetical protein